MLPRIVTEATDEEVCAGPVAGVVDVAHRQPRRTPSHQPQGVGQDAERPQTCIRGPHARFLDPVGPVGDLDGQAQPTIGGHLDGLFRRVDHRLRPRVQGAVVATDGEHHLQLGPRAHRVEQVTQPQFGRQFEGARRMDIGRVVEGQIATHERQRLACMLAGQNDHVVLAAMRPADKLRHSPRRRADDRDLGSFETASHSGDDRHCPGRAREHLR